MHLLDGEPYPEMMKRGTPQRKTVYRISLTLVKREAAPPAESGGRAAPSPRHQGASAGRSPPCAAEAEDEFETQGSARTFRTFSTGHLELGRLKVARSWKAKSNPGKEPGTWGHKDGAAAARPSSVGAAVDVALQKRRNGSERLGTASEPPRDQVPERKSPGQGKDLQLGHTCPEAQTIGGKELWPPSQRRDTQEAHGRSASRKVETPTRRNGNDSLKSPLQENELMPMPSEPDFPKPLFSREPASLSVASAADSRLPSESSADAARQTPLATDKRHPSLLRRSFSFSFRHWNGEMVRFKALSREKNHGSSSCLSGVEADGQFKMQKPRCGEASSATEKRNTLDVGEVLNKTDPLSEQERWERGKRKNRTLDNSDIHKLSENREMARESFVTGGVRSSSQEHKLFRFFSGIFSKRDGTSTPVTSPYGKGPRSRGHAGSHKKSASTLQQSSSESIDENIFQNDAFVNSQEWTLSRLVPELKVGIVGNLASGKSALVHRYLTGTYVQEESPEGGRRRVQPCLPGYLSKVKSF